jgi:ankyrin repeat protein
LSPEQEASQWTTFGRDFDSVLHLAIRENATKAALALMNAGANVHAQNGKAVTPLIQASQKGNLTIVEELWKRGACIQQASVSGCTPLIQAAHFGHLDIVEFLLWKGASMEVGNHNGTTPLMRAAQEGHYRIVELLLKKGAEVNRRNNEQMSALMLASQRGHSSIVELLADAGAQVDAMTAQDSTSLMLACKRGHVNVVRALVTAGCELCVRDSRGRTAKDMAVRRNLSELCKLLDPDVQVNLMQRKNRVQRNFTMAQLWTLLQQERAHVPLMGCNVSIHNVTEEPLSFKPQSFTALVRTMALPALLLEHVASFMPLPSLWDRRTSLIMKKCTVDSDAAVAASLELIDEALVEGGFVEACDEANVTPPTNFSSWVRI